MIPTSQSDPTNLKKNGEKAVAACEADLAKNLLEKFALSGEFSEVSLNTLDTLVKETLKPSLSRPFTEGKSFFGDLFGDPEEFGVREDDLEATPAPALTEPWVEAAKKLQATAAWKVSQNHLVVRVTRRNEAGSRVLINAVLFAAIQMVQRQIGSDRNLDDWLAERHRRPGQMSWQSRVMKGYPAEPDGSEKKVRSWVLILPEVEIDCQELIPGLSSHGIIDYVFAIVAAEEAAHQLQVSSNTWLEWKGTRDPFSSEYLAASSGCISEAKSPISFSHSRGQALVQGAAMTVIRKRPVTNILSNGKEWEFYSVFRNTQYMPGSEKSYPFIYKVSRIFDVSVDLHIILRLLCLAILRDPDDFIEQAEGVDLTKS
ncbi:hypothetical protein GGX14DRAFT_566182 [Mycena pura]|uniref:Uncharacterized protein n=1 Tax=Mycena pura TaxID=153505 RepID=A0AAD6VHH4_9AGAR|nr:hypothetical protein GGX14DRAFT_566182 [Mycena pura]